MAVDKQVIVITDYNYLDDGHVFVVTATEREQAPLADDTQPRPWRTLGDIDNVVTAELRRELCAVQGERDVYRRALRLYGNANNWAHNPAVGGDALDVFLPTLNGYTPAQDALAQFKGVM